MKRTISFLLLAGFVSGGALAQDAVPSGPNTGSGHFLWYELMTTDKDAAVDFYRYVVGWSTNEYVMTDQAQPPYTMWMAGETAVGGVMPIDSETMGDIPPHWMAYISTQDVDATVRSAQDLGAAVIAEPFDVPDVGRMAVLTDPQGAAFAVYKPQNESPVPAWPPDQRFFAWNELVTTDSDAAIDFYRQIFGWTPKDEVDMGDGWMYRLYGPGDRTYGGMFNKPPGMPAPPHWLHYVKVEGLDAAVARAKERGGQVVYGPVDVPGGDRIAQILDPQGAAFALHEPATNEP